MTFKMTIAMRTRGRIDKQLTMKRFCLERIMSNKKLKSWIDLHIVVPDTEQEDYLQEYPWTKPYLHTIPESYKSGSIFQSLLKIENRYVFCIDDDLQLDRRRDPLSPSQAGASGTYEDACDCLYRVREYFERGYVHGGISLRPYNFGVVGEFSSEVGRVCRAMFWDGLIIRKEKIRFDAVQSRSDFHMWLSLIELGYPNIIDYEFMVGENGAGKGDKGGTNTPGGCSRYRTPEFQLAQAELLKKLHPETCSIIFKQKVSPSAMKMSVPGKGIPDVRIQWAKALGIKSHLRKAKAIGKVVV